MTVKISPGQGRHLLELFRNLRSRHTQHSGADDRGTEPDRDGA